MLNRAQFKRSLQEGINTHFGLEYKRYTEEWRELFEVDTSRKAYEEDVLLSGFGAAPVKAEGAGVAYDEGSEAWAARYTHETIAIAFAITEEAQEDFLYGSLAAKYGRAAARSMIHTKEIKGANVLNNGFDSSYTGGDAKELFATDHPLEGGGSFSNELATPADLSETALEDITNQVEDFVDERGIPVAATVRKLAIPNALQFVANRILFSDHRPGTADNDINAMKHMGLFPDGWCKNHRFTDNDAWFVLTDCPDGLKHFQRVKIRRKVEGDFESGNMRHRSRERYIFGWTDPRGAAGSAGAA